MENNNAEVQASTGIAQGGDLPLAKENILIGKQGPRAGWRLLIYLMMVIGASVGLSVLVRFLFHPNQGALSAWALLGSEFFGFVIVFCAALVMSRIEKRPVGEYGLPGRGMFGGKFWLGFLFGLAAVSLLIGLCMAVRFSNLDCCTWWDLRASGCLKNLRFAGIRSLRWATGSDSGPRRLCCRCCLAALT
jgi:hypothetical protein